VHIVVSNPSHVIEGSIGAGSEGEAFAVILKDNDEGPHAEDFAATKPALLPLNDFRQNFAHSNHVVRLSQRWDQTRHMKSRGLTLPLLLPSQRGFHLQMTSEYRAVSASILLDSRYAYRNSGPAMLLTSSQNILIDNSHFADNRGNIDVHRSEFFLSTTLRSLACLRNFGSWKVHIVDCLPYSAPIEEPMLSQD
jgi:hypothetical protein